jgi:hypothetical protein
MKYAQREEIVDELPHESRLGFVAFCVERCFKEARRHPKAREQLEQSPLLTEGLDMLWAGAERGTRPDPARIDAVRKHLAGYERPARDGENVAWTRDVALVKAAGELRGGLRLLEAPDALDADVIVSALEGPEQAVGLIYKDWEAAQEGEIGVIDAALERLRDWGAKPFSRDLFEGIPEWKRGALSPKYAEGRLTGTDVNQDE